MAERQEAQPSSPPCGAPHPSVASALKSSVFTDGVRHLSYILINNFIIISAKRDEGLGGRLWRKSAALMPPRGLGHLRTSMRESSGLVLHHRNRHLAPLLTHKDQTRVVNLSRGGAEL